MATPPAGSISQNFENTNIAIQKIRTTVENLNQIIASVDTQIENAGFEGDAKLALDEAADVLQANLQKEIASLQEYAETATREVEAQVEAERVRVSTLNGMGDTIPSPTY